MHPANRGANGKGGMNWIRQDKRRKIYERDGHRCLWCGCEVRPKDNATLDHFLPRSRGGCNLSTNVFTACLSCNSTRGNESALEFAHWMACNTYHHIGIGTRRALILEGILSALDNPVERRLRR